MTTKFGVFGEAPGLGQGDPYIDTVKPDPRDAGLNFKVPGPKSGRGAAFGPLRPLAEGERYVEPLRAALAARNAARKANVSDKPWKAASPMAVSACPGDFYGTLGGAVPHVPAAPAVAKKKGEVAGAGRNIVTGPAKRGGFGFNKTTLSERQGALGVAGEYEYISDPVHAATRQRAADAPAAAPFRPANPPRRGGPGTVARHLGGRPAGAVGEFAWQPRPEAPPSRPGGAASGAAAAAAQPAAGAAFRPVSLPHKGPLATFNRFPEYLHDPEAAKAEARAAARAREREALAGRAGGAWRPGGQVKSDATRSIIAMNI
ncbi:hypothetical protein HT031_004231 [Scenedesmus sp. PABB004]|nr:hypothetical protein HT031_004231 [Scenedesmus sp. PABB004]